MAPQSKATRGGAGRGMVRRSSAKQGTARMNAGGATYSSGGSAYAPGGAVIRSPAGVGIAPPMGGALGRLGARPQGVPMRGGPPMRRPMPMPGPGGLGGALLGARAAPAPTRPPMVADPGIALHMPAQAAYKGPITGAMGAARGGSIGARKVAKQEVARHVRTAPPRGHGVR
jgi:hypothetical protein